MYRVDQRVFIVRVWREMTATSRDRPEWHASVTNAATRELFEFSSPRDLVRFLTRAEGETEAARRQKGVGSGMA